MTWLPASSFPRIEIYCFCWSRGTFEAGWLRSDNSCLYLLLHSFHCHKMARTADSAPLFPDNVPTAPLLRLSLHKLLQREDAEVERFNRACEDLGFFYLDLDGDGDSLLRDANQLFGVAEALCDLSLEEKQKYDFSSKNSYFGYKGQGAAVIDRHGNLDRNEFYNVIHWETSSILWLTSTGFERRYTRHLRPMARAHCRYPKSAFAEVLYNFCPFCRNTRARTLE